VWILMQVKYRQISQVPLQLILSDNPRLSCMTSASFSIDLPQGSTACRMLALPTAADCGAAAAVAATLSLGFHLYLPRSSALATRTPRCSPLQGQMPAALSPTAA
jgi:hypothetical protein